jgi:protocatechuate 3,4-dioxygenase beta subunit
MLRARLLLAATLLSPAVPMFASITGTVIDHDGKPVAGARVSAFALETRDARRVRLQSKSPERTPLTTATADSHGAFVINAPKDAAVVELQAEAKGFGLDVVRAERDDESITMMLPTAATKTGTITANGKPVAGAIVAWIGNGAEAIATTDAQGKYSVPDPSKWANTSLVIHPDFALNEQFYYGQRKADASLTLDPGVAVSGKVVGADGKTPVAGATLMVGTFSNVKTNDDGTFTIAHAPKKWDLIEAKSGDLIGERANNPKAPATMKLAPGATISGVLRDTKTQQPLAGAEIRLSHAQGGRGGFRFADPNASSAITDAKGNFTFSGLRPGSYDISGSRPGYSLMPANITVASAQKAQKAIAANPLARVSGMVVDEDKRPVAAANVTIDAPSRAGFNFMGLPGGERNTVSGVDGRFVLNTPRDGDVIVEATKKGYPSAKTNTFRIASGERKSGITLTIPRGIALTGRVTDNNGKPLSGVSIAAISAESGGAGGGPGVQIRRTILAAIRGGNNDEDFVQTGSDGTFTIRLKEGMYDISFKREGYAPASVRSQQVSSATRPIEVKLGPGVEIAGIVKRGGTPVSDVMVIAMGGDSQSFATTGPDGRFTVPDLLPGSYMVMLNKQDDFIQQMKTVSAPATDLTIDLPAGGRVTGHVVDKTTHQPITSFEAGISTSRSGGGMVINTPPMMKNFTSDDGSFALDNVPAGTMQIMANAPGYTTGRVPSVVIEEGKTTENVEVGLDAGVKLSGRVSGPDGAPLAGVFIRPDNGPMRGMPFGGESTTTTDANGEYTIDSLEPGEKTFSFSKSGYLTESRTSQLNSKDTRLDVQLSSGIRINGVVVTDAGAPVADASVRASSAASGGFGRTARTDANGAFLFEGVAPGHYSFVASKEGYADALSQDVNITDGGAPVRLALRTGGIVTGHILGISASDYGNVSVTIRSSTGGATQVPVDQSGNYRAEGAPTGTLRVSADFVNGFTDRRTTEVKTVELAPGGSVQVDLQFNSQTVVRGHVTRNGAPLQSAAVSFTPHAGSMVSTTGRTTTDDSGNYTVSGLSDGTYDVIVVEQRLNPYTTTYNVSGSSNFDIDIKSMTLRGRVTDSGSGDPIADATVNLRAKNNDNASFFAQRTATTDANGVFVLDSVSSGGYTATATKEGYGSGKSDVYVGDSAPADVELRLAKNDGVTLRVVDARDGRVLAAQVVAYDGTGTVAFESGPMSFGGGAEPVRAPLQPGQYRAVIAAPGYAAQTMTITSPGSPTIGLTPGGTLQIHSSSSALVRGRLVGPDGVYTRPYNRDGMFGIAGATTQIGNVQPGTYKLEIVGANGSVTNRVNVTIVEGQLASVDI